ncbi:MAG: glutamate racemase [Deltaproteobacteria bacterium]|nr:glutamate racemase [Deltaproteobacteria bacterium]
MMTDETLKKNLPIGVFDSGVGGFTVVRALRKYLPGENIIYLGDTARVPYGTKSPETVIRYSINNAKFLDSLGIKLLVVACNTASAHSITALRDNFNIPVVGVIEPGARAAVKNTISGNVGVIGTRGTIESHAYETHIREKSVSTVTTGGIPCPLFVPLAEEGWIEGEIPEKTAVHYMNELKKVIPEMDTLVLGCTHYPLLKKIISEAALKVFEREIKLIDSGVSASYVIEEILREKELFNDNSSGGTLDTYVTDTSRISEIGELFLGEPLSNVQRVDI